MKRIFALLLAAVMLSCTFATAEESVPEAPFQEAFFSQLDQLLAAFDPTRGDQAALAVSASGQEAASLLLKGAENLVDLTVKIPSDEMNDVELQFTPEEAYFASAGTVMGLRYADFPAIVQAAARSVLRTRGISLDPDAFAAIDKDALQELFQLLVQTAVMKHVTIHTAGDSTILHYAASGSDLLADLCEFTEQVLPEEKYRPLLEQLWTMTGKLSSGTDFPDLEEAIAMWPEAKEKLLAVETEFYLNLEASVRGYGQIAVTGETGVPEHLILVDSALNFDPGKGKLAADVRLTERWIHEIDGGTDVRNYDMQVKGSIIHRDGGALWSLHIDYPYPMGRFGSLILNPYRSNLVLNMNGSHLENAGRITMDMNTGRNSYEGELYYELDEDGFVSDLQVTDARGRETAVALDASNGKLGSFSFTHGYSREYAMRMLMDRLPTEPLLSVKYDGEQVIIVQDDVTIRCTGEFESDRAYLITLTPEGEHIDDPSPAYIRVTYEGQEDDWNLRAVVIDPTGSEYASATLVVSPADPVERLSGAEGLTMLTPELVEQLTGMMTSN